MGGVQGRCLPGAARREFRLSLFLLFALPYLGSPPCLPLSLSLSLSLAIERLGEGGARQSTRWMNLRRMQIRACAITLSRPGLPEK
jgi:hypothetical protein